MPVIDRIVITEKSMDWKCPICQHSFITFAPKWTYTIPGRVEEVLRHHINFIKKHMEKCK